MKQRLRQRFRYLWTWELFNALVAFPVLLLLLGLNIELGVYAWLANGSVCLLLLVGAAFAFLNYRDMQRGTDHTQAYKWGFDLLRWLLPALLLGVGVVLFRVSNAITTGERLIGGILYVLAVLEYINYFQFQLMYDNEDDLHYLLQYKRLKRGIVARVYRW